uniref:LIM/homeobox protein Lhx9 n=1 Tax=Sphaerodactylus townsendi TaxID=933632 RepID=A0ACB8F319_9SAUR
MLFHGISGGHIQGIMEEMERRSKSESRLAKAGQLNGREAHRIPSPRSAVQIRDARPSRTMHRKTPRDRTGFLLEDFGLQFDPAPSLLGCKAQSIRGRFLPSSVLCSPDSPAMVGNMPPLSPEKPALCAGCGGKISDRYYLLAVDKQWHLRCLKCCECKLALESELTCFAKDGSIYCKEDYYSPPFEKISHNLGTVTSAQPESKGAIHKQGPQLSDKNRGGGGDEFEQVRRFSVQRCARCHLGISASEMVMRARDSVYHLSCFTCTTCNKTLTTGDHFGMKDNVVYCRAHFESLLQGADPAAYPPPQLSYTELAGKGGGLALPYFNGTGTVQKGRPRKRKSPALGVDLVAYNSASLGVAKEARLAILAGDGAGSAGGKGYQTGGPSSWQTPPPSPSRSSGFLPCWGSGKGSWCVGARGHLPSWDFLIRASQPAHVCPEFTGSGFDAFRRNFSLLLVEEVTGTEARFVTRVLFRRIIHTLLIGGGEAKGTTRQPRWHLSS